jgi:predicted PurR-regulated permease PerM
VKILELLEQRLAAFEKKELYRFGLIYLAICVVLAIGIVGYYIYTIQEIKSKITLLNKTRGSVQSILTQYQVVKRQKNKVDKALKQNKTFNIQKFFEGLLQKYNITGASTTKFSSQKLPNGYIEHAMQVIINQIDTKIMSEILLDIENEPIVYINSVDITKQNFAKKINLAMSVATLRAEE